MKSWIITKPPQPTTLKNLPQGIWSLIKSNEKDKNIITLLGLQIIFIYIFNLEKEGKVQMDADANGCNEQEKTDPSLDL